MNVNVPPGILYTGLVKKVGSRLREVLYQEAAKTAKLSRNLLPIVLAIPAGRGQVAHHFLDEEGPLGGPGLGDDDGVREPLIEVEERFFGGVRLEVGGLLKISNR